MRPTAIVLLVTLDFAAMGCAANRKPAAVPSPSRSLADGKSYAEELARRVVTLERQLAEEAKARLSERADAAAALAKSKREMADRLEAISGEIRAREGEVRLQEASLKTLRRDADQCSSNLAAERKKAADLTSQKSAESARLEELQWKLAAAETAAKTSAAEASRQRDAAALESQRAKELEVHLRESTQRVTALEKDLSTAKESSQSAGLASAGAKNRVAGAQETPPTSAGSNEGRGDTHTKEVQKDALVDDLAKAHAEIDRLNALNIEQQALLDERYGVAGVGDDVPSGQPAAKRERRASANRARTAAPIAQRSDHARIPSAANESASDLTEALARRDEIQLALVRLQESPTDQSAPRKAAELQVDLDSVNSEIRRLAVLLNVEAPTR